MNALAFSILTASVAGLLTGVAMKPGTALADRPIGPQILVSGANNRVINADGWYAAPQLTGYNDQVPQYVLGTDWTQPSTYAVAYADELPQAEPVADVEVTDEVQVARNDGDFVAPVKVSSPPEVATPAHYPSQDGDILAGLHDAGGPSAIEVSAAPGDTQTS
jgi:hypothetical protein